MYLDEPQHQVQELLNATLWPGQPLGRPITGTSKTLDGMTRAGLLAYLRGNYVAGNTLLVAAGRLTHRRVVRSVARYSRRLGSTTRPRFNPARDDQQEPRIRLFTKKSEQTQIALGIRTCSRQDERRYAVRLLNTILGENCQFPPVPESCAKTSAWPTPFTARPVSLATRATWSSPRGWIRAT